ncbi:ABC transporter permease [Hymenobacter terricola]|uniref:ABC transporter permease n=1 Tax=Hymenobacter terricola TaxID=2819236 RepID=UPI001B307C56|nr:ABC transporter permease [Hymenobacter terricola]
MWHSAFRFVTYDRSNLLGILAGIVVSVVMIGLELSTFNGMLSNVQGLARQYPDYVWVVNAKTQSAQQLLNVDVRVGRELASLPGVRAVHPLVLVAGSGKSPAGAKLSMQLIGIQAPDYLGAARQYAAGTNLNDLINEGAVIVNQTDVPKLNGIRVGDHFTINDQRVYLSGLSVGLAGFGSSYAITTLERARQLSGLSLHFVSAYLVSLDTTQTPRAEVLRRINAEIGPVRALTGRQLGTETARYMLTTSNVVASFLLMVVFSVVGGFAIVALTLYSSVNDRIRDYGTIKAIGGGNGLIRRLILLQALFYATGGFVVAGGLLLLMKAATAGGEMEMTFPAWVVGALVGVTLFISLVSSLIAMRRITKLEPVQIFRM